MENEEKFKFSIRGFEASPFIQALRLGGISSPSS